MDELQLIRTVLAAPEPSEEMVDRGRLVLLERSHGPARQRRTGVVAGAGLSLTAAAAAAVALVVSQTGGPVPTGNGPPAGAAAGPAGTGQQHGAATKAPVDVRALSGRQVLLLAATSAAARPDGAGAYWHVRSRDLPVDGPAGRVQDTWAEPDGTTWTRLGSDKVIRMLGPSGFQLAHDQLTLAQLRRLPTDPAALTRFVHDSFTQTRYARVIPRGPQGEPGPPTVVRGDPLPAVYVPSETAIALAGLLYGVPVPAAVRAAAFGALAAMPGVRNLGPVAGGVALRVALPPPPPGKYGAHPPVGLDHYDLTVDPATATIRSTTNYQGTTRILAAGWTDQRPR
jgi:hypothetical protein